MEKTKQIEIRKALKEDGEARTTICGEECYMLYDDCARTVEIYRAGTYKDCVSNFADLIDYLDYLEKLYSPMSRRAARRLIANEKHGCTVKEFLKTCEDMGNWFNEIEGTDLEEAYSVLVKKVS